MKNLFLLIAGTAVFITLVGLYVNGDLNLKPNQKEVKIGNTIIPVELANSLAKRSKGLSGKTSLPENSGMLFNIDQKNSEPAFWMKEMNFSIDIIWIKDLKITKIDADVPFPAKETLDSDLKLYKPDGPVDYVLEVNAGFCQKNNISEGNSVEL